MEMRVVGLLSCRDEPGAAIAPADRRRGCVSWLAHLGTALTLCHALKPPSVPAWSVPVAGERGLTIGGSNWIEKSTVETICVLDCIKITVTSRTREKFLTLYCGQVKPHLQCFVWDPQHRKDNSLLEPGQGWALMMLQEI